MSALLIQRCANGFIVAPPGAAGAAQAYIFPDSITADADQAAAFIAWIDTETRKVDPQPVDVRSELTGVNAALNPGVPAA